MLTKSLRPIWGWMISAIILSVAAPLPIAEADYLVRQAAPNNTGCPQFGLEVRFEMPPVTSVSLEPPTLLDLSFPALAWYSTSLYATSTSTELTFSGITAGLFQWVDTALRVKGTSVTTTSWVWSTPCAGGSLPAVSGSIQPASASFYWAFYNDTPNRFDITNIVFTVDKDQRGQVRQPLPASGQIIGSFGGADTTGARVIVPPGAGVIYRVEPQDTSLPKTGILATATGTLSNNQQYPQVAFQHECVVPDSTQSGRIFARVVQNSDQSPLPDVRVLLFDAQSEKQIGKEVTDKDGFVSFPAPAPGVAYLLKADLEGPSLKSARAGIAGSLGVSNSLQVTGQPGLTDYPGYEFRLTQ